MKPTTSNEIRQAFLDFFAEMGHSVVPSSPLPVKDNPTLFFTNAGMNQFVDTFLGLEERPYKRATTAQKCMRIQGKHNDLENVGPSPWHHTFFEMLGNFSFGDYFKARAIRYAYDFLTRVCEVPVDRLWYTVHESDDEAERIWLEEVGVDPARVIGMGDETNFWMMGDVGPCGPTSEIHYDWGPENCTCHRDDCHIALDNGCGRWLEVWNLVFMQFNQDESGARTPLPRTGVDTGMGLERLTVVMQGTPVTYHTDLFRPAMDELQQLLGDDDAARAAHETGYRVIADHVRAATFLIADGVMPGNEGGRYVLRMIIRRAARFGREIGFDAPFMARVADVYIEQMGDAYPALRAQRERIALTLTQEEERFARTLDSALSQLDKILAELSAAGATTVSGAAAFDLYATRGLPLEITRDVVQERGFTVDEHGYDEARAAHALASGSGAFGQYDTAGTVYTELAQSLINSGRLDAAGVEYDPYGGAHLTSEILALVQDGRPVPAVPAGQAAEVVTAATPFYVEAGGEVSDTGRIVGDGQATFDVADTRQPVPGLILHVGQMLGDELRVGDIVRLEVDDARRQAIRRNHTATHLLHRELRAQLGHHVTQAGSLVAPDRLRFDFTYDRAVDPATLAAVETAVNEAILANRPVASQHMPQREALAQGAMALFGEKYGEVVRTIAVGGHDAPYSFELCGGLHVAQTAEIGLFRITNETAVAAGVRRIEAVTGRGAYDFVAERLAMLERLARQVSSPVAELESRLTALLEEQRALRKELSRYQREEARGQLDALLQQLQTRDGVRILAAQVDADDGAALREMADWFRDHVNSGAAVLAGVKGDRPLLLATVTEDLISRGLRAGDLLREVAGAIGGSGGGRPNLAQGGGGDPARLPAALAAVPDLVARALDS